MDGFKLSKIVKSVPILGSRNFFYIYYLIKLLLFRHFQNPPRSLAPFFSADFFVFCFFFNESVYIAP